MTVRTSAPDVYMPIEVTTREYAGVVRTAVELAARGLNVLFGYKKPVVPMMRAAERPGVFFYKSGVNPNNGSAAAVVGQDPEAGISRLDYADFYAERGILHDLSQIDAHFCFGQEEYDFLRAAQPESSDRIFLTGSPRISLWGSEGDIFYEREVARVRKKYPRFVLFASSGGIIQESHPGPTDDVRTTWDPESDVEGFFRAAAFVAGELGIQVVIRTHPSDSWARFAEVATSHPGIAVEWAYDLSVWARAAIAVVHPGTSTAALESVAAGTPAISLGAGSAEQFVSSRISHVATTLERLEELLTASPDLPTLPSEEARHLLERKILHPLDGAAARIADLVLEHVAFDGPSALSARRNPRIVHPRTFVGNRRPPKLGATLPPPFKRLPLNLVKVRRDVAAAHRIAGRPERLEVFEQAPNAYLVRRRS